MAIGQISWLIYGRSLLNKRHPGGWTALHAAVCNQHEEVVKFLIANGANVNVADLYQPVRPEQPKYLTSKLAELEFKTSKRAGF